MSKYTQDLKKKGEKIVHISSDAARFYERDIVSNLSRLTSHQTKESICPKCQQEYEQFGKVSPPVK